MDAKKPTLRHIRIKMPEVKDKERILKAAREKKLVTYRGVPMRLSADFSKEILQSRKYILARNIQNHEAGNYSQDCSTQKRYHLESKGR